MDHPYRKNAFGERRSADGCTRWDGSLNGKGTMSFGWLGCVSPPPLTWCCPLGKLSIALKKSCLHTSLSVTLSVTCPPAGMFAETHTRHTIPVALWTPSTPTSKAQGGRFQMEAEVPTPMRCEPLAHFRLGPWINGGVQVTYQPLSWHWGHKALGCPGIFLSAGVPFRTWRGMGKTGQTPKLVSA